MPRVRGSTTRHSPELMAYRRDLYLALSKTREGRAHAARLFDQEYQPAGQDPRKLAEQQQQIVNQNAGLPAPAAPKSIPTPSPDGRTVADYRGNEPLVP